MHGKFECWDELAKKEKKRLVSQVRRNSNHKNTFDIGISSRPSIQYKMKSSRPFLASYLYYNGTNTLYKFNLLLMKSCTH